MAKTLTWRFTLHSFLIVSGLAVGCVLLIACGSTSGPTQPTATNPAASTVQPAATSAASETAQPAAASSESKPTESAMSGTVSLEIGTATGATEFKYDKVTLEAPAGSQITLKFSNNTALKDEVGHNWVLVKPGQEASVIANAIAAGDDQDWLKEDDPGVIAHTSLIEGEANDTITFDAPAPGSYSYICTFPKHFEGGMKGTLTIK
jgi:azurin